MATFYGVNNTKAITPAPATYMGTESKGRVKVIQDKYEAASLAAGSVILVGEKFNKGETFVMGWVTADDLSSAGTLALGDVTADDFTTGDADRYLAATVFTTANQQSACNKEDGRGYTATEDMYFALTTATEEMTGTIFVTILVACP